MPVVVKDTILDEIYLHRVDLLHIIRAFSDVDLLYISLETKRILFRVYRRRSPKKEFCILGLLLPVLILLSI